MSLTRKVTDWLFFVPEGDRSLRDIVFWWEVRSVPYNLIVGGVGLCSLILFFVLIEVSGKLKPGEDAVEPLGLIVAPFAMNICYTAGWVVEALLVTSGTANRNQRALHRQPISGAVIECPLKHCVKRLRVRVCYTTQGKTVELSLDP